MAGTKALIACIAMLLASAKAARIDVAELSVGTLQQENAELKKQLEAASARERQLRDKVAELTSIFAQGDSTEDVLEKEEGELMGGTCCVFHDGRWGNTRHCGSAPNCQNPCRFNGEEYKTKSRPSNGRC